MGSRVCARVLRTRVAQELCLSALSSRRAAREKFVPGQSAWPGFSLAMLVLTFFHRPIAWATRLASRSAGNSRHGASTELPRFR
jgi:hypothetical protein